MLGDDLALNAQQVSGIAAERELPVVWAVAKGSFINKAILVPAALAISAFAPWAVTPLLMIGGAFLCFEGFEKLAHKFLHSRSHEEAHEEELAHALLNPAIDMRVIEKEKIRGAIRTDFILSGEIIVITLGIVAQSEFIVQLGVLTGIAIVMTVGVYGLVAGIVKLDDFGLYLTRARQRRRARRRCRDPARGTLADEGAFGRRYGRHVPGGRRHPRARHPAAASRHRAARRRRAGTASSRRLAQVADASGVRRDCRHQRREGVGGAESLARSGLGACFAMSKCSKMEI